MCIIGGVVSEKGLFVTPGAQISETVWNDLAFTGREYDFETGLLYLRARYYDPEAGRFVSKDPIGFAGGDVNLYGYILGNPVNRVDLSGIIWHKKL